MSMKPTKLYGVVDPNWNEPYVIPGTVTSDRDQSVRKAETHPHHSLYGGWNNLLKQGYRLAEVEISVIREVEYQDEEIDE